MSIEKAVHGSSCIPYSWNPAHFRSINFSHGSPEPANNVTKKYYVITSGALFQFFRSEGVEEVSGVSRRTIWSRAYYSALIQSHCPCLNKSASFPRGSPILYLSFFPFHGPALSRPHFPCHLARAPTAECSRFNSKWLPRVEVAPRDILRTFEEVDRTSSSGCRK